MRQCRNDSLGFTVTVPGYVYGSPADDSAVLGSCEALDARPLKSGDDLSAGVVTAPIVFTRLADTLDNMKSQDAGGTSHFTTVANQRALVIENRLSSDDGPFKAGSRTYTYYVDTSPTVFVGQLLISPLESSAAYAAHKQIMDTIMSSLEFNPASICKNLHVPKCGEFYFTQNVTAAPVMVTASVAPSTVHVGDTVTLTIKASDTDADVFSCIPFFAGPHVNLPATGPGSSLLDRIRDRGAAGGAFGPWDVPAAKGGSTTLTYTNKYTAAGQYQAGADCFVDNSNAKAKGDPYDPWHASGSGQVNVTVS